MIAVNCPELKPTVTASSARTLASPVPYALLTSTARAATRRSVAIVLMEGAPLSQCTSRFDG
jgi:hypothetical protein